MDPALLTKAFRLKPSHALKAGEPRRTPKGTSLKGINRNTYWFKRLVAKRHASTSKRSLEAFLASTLARLSRHAMLFRRLRRSGGRAEIFIGLFCESSNHGVELPPTLLAALGKVGLSLSFDIYR
jgi:hypothetical protein